MVICKEVRLYLNDIFERNTKIICITNKKAVSVSAFKYQYFYISIARALSRVLSIRVLSRVVSDSLGELGNELPEKIYAIGPYFTFN